jgi:TolA-binding protein
MLIMKPGNRLRTAIAEGEGGSPEGTAQAGGPDTGNPQTAKTFTEDDVNQIVERRLARERLKYQDYDELKDKAAKVGKLQEQLEKTNGELDGIKKAQTLQMLKSKIAAENHIPAELLDGDTEDALNAKAEIVKKYINKAPVLPDQGKVPSEQGTTENAQYIRGLFSGGQQ